MIGFIKNLISSVLSFLVGLFGGKKSQENKQNKSLSAEKPSANAKTRKRNGYFMELDEAEEVKSGNGNQPAKAKAKTSEPVAKAQPAKAESAKPNKADANTQPAKAESAKSNKADANAQPAKAESAKPNKTDANAQPAKESAKEVELVQTAQGVKAEPAKKEKAAAASANGQIQAETTFAPKYLAPSVTSSNGRRRPGPSMNNFLDMARQVKTPGKA